MSRPNTDKVKKLIKDLSEGISRYGEEGKAELRQLFEARPPSTILSLPPGPTREALAAELIGDMREIARELAEAKAARIHSEIDKRERGESKKPKAPVKKVERKPNEIIARTTGKINGFIFVIAELFGGDYIVKITRKGRRVIEDERAPSIYDNKSLSRTFRSKDEAEMAARRVVNTAMIWYEERGLTPREKARRSKAAGRGGVLRRTASERSSISREESETARINRKKKKARERKDRMLEEKVSGRRSNPHRNLSHLPRKNPGGFFSFKHSEKSTEVQAGKSLALAKKYKSKWESSLKDGRPDFRSLMRAYDALENARANLFLAGKQEEAEKVDSIRTGLRDTIIGIFGTCYKHLSGRDFQYTNPGKDAHHKIGTGLIEKASASMDKYGSTGSTASLLDAYKYYEMAAKECKYSGHKSGLTKATAGAKKARAELTKKTRG